MINPNLFFPGLLFSIGSVFLLPINISYTYIAVILGIVLIILSAIPSPWEEKVEMRSAI